MDILTDVLQIVGAKVRVHGCVTVNGATHRLPNDWGEERGSVYAIGRGRVRVDCQGGESIELEAGDALFLVRECSCSLINAPGERKPSDIVVGRIEFGVSQANAEVLGWPSVLHLRSVDDAGGLVGRLMDEVLAAQPGFNAASTSLANALLVAALRAHRTPSCECPAYGWLRGLSDPEIGPALRLIHKSPSHPWTVAELADRLSISRSGFAAKFKQTTGRPPLAYVTWWRLCRAAARLRRRDGATIAQVAYEVGYETESAFGKAFRKQFGRTPGQIRREATELPRRTPLQVELKKRHPFDVREQEVAINLHRSAAKLSADFVALLTPHGIQGGQYNVLRILRGEGTALSLAEVRSRLVADDENIGASVSSLVAAGFVETDSAKQLLLTPRGDALLAALDGPLIDLHRRQLAHFSPEELIEFNRLLVKARRPDQ